MEEHKEIMDKIKLMEKWTKEQRSNFPVLSSDRIRAVNSIYVVDNRINEARAVLQFLQRGHIFDLPEEVEK